MVGKVLDLDQLLSVDQLGCEIANHWCQWDMMRATKKVQWDELRSYIYATDTKNTTNSKLPWKNTTTIPKICQIRDNLFANYMASMFPKRKWLIWEASDKKSNSLKKRNTIQNYMSYCVDQDRFKKEMSKCVLDYIDYGNCFSTIEWVDETIKLSDGGVQVGYVGPSIKRISPLDIVMNPTAASFEKSPKIIRSLVSIGEVKDILEQETKPDNKEAYDELWKYLKDLRVTAGQFTGVTEKSKNDYFRVDGFTNFISYLSSNTCELLTFYGDIYDSEKDQLLKNHVIVVVDRHKVILKKPNPSYFGYPPIFHCGWRPRQDNLWAMGPLDNLVGMQYRIDHVENLKADVFDLIAFPLLKVKGFVEDFEWKPMEKITCNEDSDVEMIAPPFQVLQANQEIEVLANRMEEMAGSPKEAMGFRTPGEKTAYEVQRLENAASRLFSNKISQFEEQFEERNLNGMLELGRRMMASESIIRIFDDEFKVTDFQTLTPDDITGAGRIRPIAARHFAERAETIQNLNNFFSSPMGQDQNVLMHFSSLKQAQMIEELLDLQDYELVQSYIRLSEQADAKRLMNTHSEQVQMESQTPSGLSQDDVDPVMQ